MSTEKRVWTAPQLYVLGAGDTAAGSVPGGPEGAFTASTVFTLMS